MAPTANACAVELGSETSGPAVLVQSTDGASMTYRGGHRVG